MLERVDIIYSFIYYVVIELCLYIYLFYIDKLTSTTLSVNTSLETKQYLIYICIQSLISDPVIDPIIDFTLTVYLHLHLSVVFKNQGNKMHIFGTLLYGNTLYIIII